MGGRYPVVADNTAKVVQFPEQQNHSEMSDDEAKKIAISKMPRGFTPLQKKIWKSDIPEYVKINRFKDHFIRFYKEYVVLLARMEETLAYLNQENVGWKYTTSGRNGIQHKTRPEAAQYNDDWRKFNSVINQIGGSPATEQRFNNMQPSLFDDCPY